MSEDNINLLLEKFTNNESELDKESKEILEQNYKYYNEFCKLLQANDILKGQYNNFINEKNNLKNTLVKLESQFKNNSSNYIVINDTYTNRKVRINQ